MHIFKLSVVIVTALIVGHMIFARGDYADQLDSPVYRSTLKDALKRFKDSELVTTKDGVIVTPGPEGTAAPRPHAPHLTPGTPSPSRPQTPYPRSGERPTRPSPLPHDHQRDAEAVRPSMPYSKAVTPPKGRSFPFPNSPPSKEVDEARQAYFKGEFDDGIKMLSAFLTQNPGHIGARYYFASCLMAQRKHSEALLQYEQCVKDAPENAQLYQALASAYRMNKQPEKAVAAAEKALEIAPGSEYIQRLLASLYLATGQKDKYQELITRQESTYKANIAKDPNNQRHCFNLASLYRQSGRNLEEALVLAQKACKLKPGEAIYHSLLAKVLMRLERLEEAIASINTAIELDQTSKMYPLVKRQIERMQSSK